MLKVLSNILCDLDPKVKVIGQKAGICDGVPSTSALVLHYFTHRLSFTFWLQNLQSPVRIFFHFEDAICNSAFDPFELQYLAAEL